MIAKTKGLYTRKESVTASKPRPPAKEPAKPEITPGRRPSAPLIRYPPGEAPIDRGANHVRR
jgi:hypothetical protein